MTALIGIRNYVCARLREPSTWRGLCALAGAAGLVIAPAQIELITSMALAAIGLLGTLPDARVPR